MLRSRAALTIGSLLCSLHVCCGTPDADARPQLVVVVDTDLPTVGLVTEDDTLALDAAVDTLSIDAIGTCDALDVVAPDPRDWPVSFGIPSEFASNRRIRLRLRLFRGRLAAIGVDDCGNTTLVPKPEVTVDRGLDLELPEQGVRTVLVRLSGDCLNTVPNFGAGETCIDGARPSSGLRDGVSTIERTPLPASRVGTWANAREVPCSTPETADRECIPGGFTLLGDPDLVGFADGIDYKNDPLPLRPVVVSPFFLDRNEYTVARLKALLARPDAPNLSLPDARNPASRDFRHCTWLGPDDPASDALPLNCIQHASSLEICRAEGGSLPSEAQWEHAARGRGAGRPYPWGEVPPTCCTASLARDDATCPGIGPEASGAHADPRGCAVSDVSRDGVLDLGGNVSEQQLDRLQPYSQGCWSAPGVRVDPVCDAEVDTYAIRGGNWERSFTSALAALRTTGLDGIALPTIGFRCAYPDRRQ
jgi:formylglycine-generating enzyme required for sulfatase activity